MMVRSTEMKEGICGGIEIDDFGLGGNVIFTGNRTGVHTMRSGYVKRESTVLKTLMDEEEQEDGNADSESDQNGEQEVFCVHGRSKFCRHCGKSFFSISAAKEHYVMCKVPSQSRLLVERSVRHAHYLIQTSQLPVKNEAKNKPELPTLDVSETVKTSALLESKLTTRLTCGNKLGANFIEPF